LAPSSCLKFLAPGLAAKMAGKRDFGRCTR
jgi:hypothetical protein